MLVLFPLPIRIFSLVRILIKSITKIRMGSLFKDLRSTIIIDVVDLHRKLLIDKSISGGAEGGVQPCFAGKELISGGRAQEWISIV